MAIKRADGTVIDTKKDKPTVMEEIILNDEKINIENESDEDVSTVVKEEQNNGLKEDTIDAKVEAIENNASVERVVKKTSLKIEAPWYRFYKILVSLFANDASINIKCSDVSNEIFAINFTSVDTRKLAAIRKVIGEERQMGNTRVLITYSDEASPLSLDEFVAAFKDTGYLVDAKTAETPTGDPIFFPIMKKDIIQFYNDNLNDYYGNLSLTVTDAVKEVMDADNVPANFFVSTDSNIKTEDEVD